MYKNSAWYSKLLAMSCAAAAFPGQAIADAENTLEEIIVTAQKREERLREVPISISAVTGEQLQRSGATRFSDAAGYVPGMTYQPGISGAPGEGRFNLRGVSSAGAPIATTAIYVDDVPTTTHGSFGGSSFKALDLFPYDVERVEVLRGPQGTLYGDSTIGGLIKYVTKKADVNEFSSSVGTEGIYIDGGDGIGGGARGVINAPISPGVFGVRLSGFYQETPGYLTNLATEEEGTNRVEQRGLRLAARLTPSEDFSVDAQWLHTEFESGDRALTQLVPGTTRPLRGDYLNFSPVAQPTSQEFDLASLTGRYDFGPVNLTSASAYSKVVRGFTADYTFFVRGVVNGMTGGAVTDALGIFSNPNQTEKYTQELRLESTQDQSLTWLVGGYYSVEKTDLRSLTIPQYADGAPITNLPEIYKEHLKAEYTDVSLFANATYKITGKWEISAGVRQSRITDEYNTSYFGVLVGSQTPFTDASDTDYDATTWSLGTRYIANDDLMMFARVATGFRAGSTNSNWPGVPPGYGPDDMISYEAGVRADFFDDRASIDTTVYWLEWTDLFITAYTPDDMSYTTNGGKANGAGIEFTGTVRPARSWSLTATAAYFGLKVREDLPTAGARAGDRPPATPALSGSVMADYAIPLHGTWELLLGGGIRWASHSYSRFESDPVGLRIDGYTVADLNATVSNDRWSLRGYVRNLTNEDSVQSIGLDNRGVQMMPRTTGLSLDVKF
jgi:outer membrane receptor protein involved in Fe transport